MKRISMLLLVPILLCCVSCEPEGESPGVDQTYDPVVETPEPVQETPAQTDATPAEAPPSANPVVRMETSKGVIRVELYAEKAPITVDNFLGYAKRGFYNGTIFHRVMPGFMIQGGGMTPSMQEKITQGPIKNESYNQLRNARGTIAMARRNPPDSATSQFFINHADNRSLDFDGPMAPGYAVFGKVIEGMDVVDAIAAVPTRQAGPHGNVPVEPVVIESVTVE